MKKIVGRSVLGLLTAAWLTERQQNPARPATWQDVLILIGFLLCLLLEKKK